MHNGLRQRGELPELRGQAAAQAVVLKPPAERDHGGRGKCDVAARGTVPRWGGSQVPCQRGEQSELRGQAAA